MAEYLPLIERAVSGLTDASPEARRAIYERARSALLGQLRRMDPPIPDADIARESEALDEAIGRVESTFRSPEPEVAAGIPPAPPVITPPTGRPGLARPARGAEPASVPMGTEPGASGPPLRERRVAPIPRRSPLTSQPPNLPAAQTPPLIRPPVRDKPPLAPRAPSAPRPTMPILPMRDPADGTPADTPRTQPAARPLNTAPRVSVKLLAGDLVQSPPVAAQGAAGVEPSVSPVAQDFAAGPAPSVSPAPASARATHPIEAQAHVPVEALGREADEETAPFRRRRLAFTTAAAIGALLVAGIAAEAWRLRDRPDQVTGAQPASQAETAGKLVDRAGAAGNGGAPAQTDSATIPAPVASGTGTADANATAPIANDAAPPGPPMNAAGTITPLPGTDAPTQAVGVTERAALLVDASDDPQKVKTYVGFVVWKSDSRSSGQGQPLSQVVIADVDIPDAKITMTMVLNRNTEPQFPASHTIEITFKDEAGSAIGPIKQINVPEMRPDDASPTGDPLLGLPVTIKDNHFLVGLSRGQAEGANTQMLETRNWLDVPLLLASGKVAKITFEKGTPGRRTIDDAFKSWASGG